LVSTAQLFLTIIIRELNSEIHSAACYSCKAQDWVSENPEICLKFLRDTYSYLMIIAGHDSINVNISALIVRNLQILCLELTYCCFLPLCSSRYVILHLKQSFVHLVLDWQRTALLWTQDLLKNCTRCLSGTSLEVKLLKNPYPNHYALNHRQILNCNI